MVALRWRPEWWVAVLVVLAWAALLTGLGGHEHVTVPPGHEHHHHVLEPAPRGVLSSLPVWTLMAAAMMVPATLPAVRHVGLNSMRHRRQRAMAIYAAVYVAVWAVFGLAALAAVALLIDTAGASERALLAGTLALAAGWQWTRSKRRAVLACRSTVALPPLGLRADAASARFAFSQSGRCVRSCWALMAVMAVTHTSLPWMIALTALVVSEELTGAGRRVLKHSGAALGVVAVLVAAGL